MEPTFCKDWINKKCTLSKYGVCSHRNNDGSCGYDGSPEDIASQLFTPPNSYLPKQHEKGE